ncbi:hypothetical protein LZ30DRAFT_713542 [Colletotrichum cereale]|nr:hypothetical protein LZ30DRAFT_713542 [Colletotrichum cereale]
MGNRRRPHFLAPHGHPLVVPTSTTPFRLFYPRVKKASLHHWCLQNAPPPRYAGQIA